MKRMLALYTHWCIADSVRYAMFHTDSEPEQAHLKKELGEQWFELATLMSSAWRMSVFYALEYVVIEGYKELGDAFEPIDTLLDDADSVDKLRLFRNAIFHYEEEPLRKKRGQICFWLLVHIWRACLCLADHRTFHPS
ncbi:MAG: hypothetical protein V3W33_07490 [Gammaproteobacteria bacterium]